uniref:CSON010535 protein n=1 Tax=Culicoides sonorensis TaxID=179676 RepID=A0A336LKM1_CULSO
MRNLILLISISVAFTAADYSKNEVFRSPRIVGGEITDIKDFPYQLSVRHYNYHICGASIISATHALTLGTCLEFLQPPQITFLAGSSNIFNSKGFIAKALQFIFHPQFNGDTNEYDVVIAVVDKPFIGLNIQPVKLATQNMPLPLGLNAVIAGWGDTNTGELNSLLHKVELPIVNTEDCKIAWNGEVSETMVCAGRPGADTCSSDNGGPLVYCGLQIGINVRNSMRCDGAQPALFTDITHPVIRAFIREKTGV